MEIVLAGILVAEATVEKSGARVEAEGYVPISVEMMMSLHDVYIHADIFVLHEGLETPTLFRSRSYASSAENFRSLTGVDALYIRSSDYAEFQSELAASLETILRRDAVPPAWRICALQAAVETAVGKALRMINSDPLVQQSMTLGRQVAGLLHNSNTLPSDLFQVLRHDYYTFTHMMNVSSYSVVLAEALGIQDQNQLEQIATGGMLHDLGKRLIPPLILNKPKRLSEKEYDLIQTHPQKGYEELLGRNEISHGQLMMVYQHHENIDGTGYPVRITGVEMHDWARICAVVDVFDAMTCERPYRKALGIGHVLEFMDSVAGTHLDKDMVQCWAELMSVG